MQQHVVLVLQVAGKFNTKAGNELVKWFCAFFLLCRLGNEMLHWPQFVGVVLVTGVGVSINKNRELIEGLHERKSIWSIPLCFKRPDKGSVSRAIECPPSDRLLLKLVIDMQLEAKSIESSSFSCRSSFPPLKELTDHAQKKTLRRPKNHHPKLGILSN